MSVGQLEAALVQPGGGPPPIGDPPPAGEPQELQALRDMVALVDGRTPAPRPGAPAPQTEPVPTPAATPPAPSPYEQAFALQAQQLAQTQAQIGQLAQLLQHQAQYQPAAPQLSRHEEMRAMADEMRAARLDPASERDVLTYQLWQQNQQLQSTISEKLQQLEQYQYGLQQSAQQYALKSQLGAKVKETLSQFKGVPEATLASITSMAEMYAAQLPPEQAIQQALTGFMPLLQKLKETPAGPTPSPSALPAQPNQFAQVPAFAGMNQKQIEAALTAMTAAATSGRGAGRHNGATPPDLETIERILFRP